MSSAEPTHALARYVVETSDAALSAPVRHAARRSLVNIVGCMVGGARHAVVATTEAALAEFAGAPRATLAGRDRRTDALHAALLNGLACSAYAFDDTHARAIVHPSGPVVSALFPLAERSAVGGAAFLTAFALGVEVVCRASCAISVEPARGDVSWMQTGVAGGLGAAAAAGKLLGLDVRRMVDAIAIAASQASGIRSLHGTMCIPLIPAHAGQTGLRAALLAAGGLTCTKATLEADMGFLAVFAESPDLDALAGCLGERHEILSNTFKPYPCGIVIHAVLDACLALREAHAIAPQTIEAVRIVASPVTVKLTGKRAADAYQARTSLYYWAAVALLRGQASIDALEESSFADPRMQRLQDRMTLAADESLASDAAIVDITLADGRVLRQCVDHASGSASHPMTDADLDRKFLALCVPVLGETRARTLLSRCWMIDELPDAAELVRATAA